MMCDYVEKAFGAKDFLFIKLTQYKSEVSVVFLSE